VFWQGITDSVVVIVLTIKKGNDNMVAILSINVLSCVPTKTSVMVLTFTTMEALVLPFPKSAFLRETQGGTTLPVIRVGIRG
jgi:hypothetical protein